MDNWIAFEVEANGIRLHVTRTGGDHPAIVLAHGSTDDGGCWGQVATALAPEHDVIMVDARGHGHSDAPPDGYDLVTLAQDLAGVISALDLSHPAIIGHSLGAGLALVVAGTYPELPRAILLEDPGPWWTGWPTTQNDLALLAHLCDQHHAYTQQSQDDLVAERRQRRPRWDAGEQAAWATAKRRMRPAAFQVFSPDLARGIDWPELLGHITCPVLLITTDPVTGGVVTPTDAAALQAFIPHLHHAHIPGAGHSIRRDQFAPYRDVVQAFLSETSC